MKEVLNIYELCVEGTRSLGPGLRYVIWVQGCLFNCKGCTSPESKPLKFRNLISVDELVFSITKHTKITGLTISGGEPFLQAKNIIKLIKRVKIERPEIDVIIYTGFNFAELDWDEAKELLSLVDLIIDGKYVEELNDDIGIRGSSNQKVHYISDKLKVYADEIEFNQRKGELYITNNSTYLIGIPNKTKIINV